MTSADTSPLLPAQQRLPRRTFLAAAISSLLSACGGGTVDGDGGLPDGPSGPRLTVASMTPEDGAQNVEPDIEPLIRFSAPLASLPADEDLITLNDRALKLPLAAFPALEDPATVRLRPQLQLSLASRYDIRFDARLRGTGGERFAGSNASFTTRDGLWSDAIASLAIPAQVGPKLLLDGDVWGRTVAVFSEPAVGIHAADYTAAGGWSNPQQLCVDIPGDFAMGVASLAGTVVTIWRSGNAQTAGQLHACLKVQGDWTTPQRIDAEEMPIYEPRLAVSRDGRAIATWIQVRSADGNRRSVHVSVLDPATLQWSAPKFYGTGDDPTFSPRIAIDSQGRAVLAWARGRDVFAARYSPQKGWSSTITVFTGAATTEVNGMDVFVSDNGDALVLVATRENNGAPLLGSWRLRAEAASFEPRQEVNDDDEGIYYWSCVADAAGRFVIVWSTADAIGSAAFDAAAGSWSPLPGLKDGLAPQRYRRDPRVRQDLHGHLIVSWTEYDAGTQAREAWACRRLAGATTWGTPRRLSESGEYVDTTFLHTSILSGESIVAWMRNNPSRAIASRLFS